MACPYTPDGGMSIWLEPAAGSFTPDPGTSIILDPCDPAQPALNLVGTEFFLALIGNG